MPNERIEYAVMFIEESADAILPPISNNRTLFDPAVLPLPGDHVVWPDPEGSRRFVVKRREFTMRQGGVCEVRVFVDSSDE